MREVADGIGNRAETVQETLESARIEVELSPDPIKVIWSKFVILWAIAGITSVARTRIKEFIQRPEAMGFFRNAMREVETVGRANGVNLPLDQVDNFVKFIRGSPDFQNSMHADLENGRLTELEALNGPVTRMGLETDIHSPVNQFIYPVLLPLNGRN